MAKKTIYQRLEQIVQEKQFQQIKFPDLKIIEEVDPQDQHQTIKSSDGMIVDMQTANMLITVIAALSIKNQKKAKKMLETWYGFEKMVNFGWSKVK